MKNKLISTLERNKDKYIKYLKDLISIDTQVIGHGIEGGKEKEGQLYIKSLLESMGAETIIDQLKEETILKGIDLYNEGNQGHCYEDRFNVYGSFNYNENGRTILFNGHVDTMPPGNLDEWTTNPWEPVIKDGKLYGLGSCDMKAGLMAAIMAMKLIQDCDLKLKSNVTINSVVDEEGGGNGTLAAVLAGNKADAAIVCEPSDEKVFIAHMGFVFFEIKVKGVALHSAEKWKGVSAIEKIIKIIHGLNELEHDWLMTYKHPLLPSPTINVGVINGGSAGSTVADSCSIKICVHYIPNTMSHEQVKEEILNTITLTCNGDAWLKNNKPEISIYQAGGGFEMDYDHPFINTVANSYESIMERRPKISGSTAGNDARLLKNIANIPTVITGPGCLKECHSVDEYISVDLYFKYILIYAEIILNFCDYEN